MSEPKKFPWAYIGCGCAVLTFVGIAGIAGLMWVGVQTARDIADPDKMHERGTRLLGAETLPAGYDVELALDLPLSIELVVLDGGSRQFVYTRGIGRSKRLADFEAGEIGLVDLLESAGVQMGSGEILSTDRADFDPLQVDWLVYRGDVDFEEAQGHARAEMDLDDVDEETLVAVALLRCPRDRKLRMGIWRGPDPDPEVAAERLDLTGSTGDPDEVRALFSGFRICD